MSLDDDSYFDDLVTLYVGKGVASYSSDEDILGPLIEKLDEEHTKADLKYYRTKINRARMSQGIDDPRIARNKFVNNVIYVKQTNKYFDLKTNQEYHKDAINFEYSAIFSGVSIHSLSVRRICPYES